MPAALPVNLAVLAPDPRVVDGVEVALTILDDGIVPRPDERVGRRSSLRRLVINLTAGRSSFG